MHLSAHILGVIILFVLFASLISFLIPPNAWETEDKSNRLFRIYIIVMILILVDMVILLITI